MRVPALALVLALAAAAPAAAIVVDAEDTTRHRQAPPDGRDPGWAHVGRLGGVSAVYLGHGWILTAAHAGFADVTIDGVRYPAVPDSRVELSAPDGSGQSSDLALFRVDPAPDLPSLRVHDERLGRGGKVTLIGFGRGRGERDEGDNGWHWSSGHAKHWGTNRISDVGLDLAGPQQRSTRCFSMDFSRHGTPDEAQAAMGDSGGAVFAKHPDGWRLVGVMVSISDDRVQGPRRALYGNLTHAADLSAYALQIRRVQRAAEGP